MEVRIVLRYAREPELVALRLNPGIHMQGLAKQVLRAQAEGQDFRIHMQKDAAYVQKPLAFRLTLDEEADGEIIRLLASQCAPAAAFIRNALIRCIRGSVGFIYRDPELKKTALSCRRNIKPLSAMMAQSGVEQEEKDDLGSEDALLLAARELEKA